MASLSYGYKMTLMAPVADDGTVVLPWPEADAESGLVGTANYEVAVGNRVYSHAEASAVFNGTEFTITVTNLSGAAWPQAQDVYVSAPRNAMLVNNVEGMFIAIEQELYDHEGRISALEAAAP